MEHRTRSRARRAVGAVAGSLALGAVVLTPVGEASGGTQFCGTRLGQTPAITKVIWLLMENRSYGSGSSQIPGSPSAPYIRNTLFGQCGTTTDFHAVTHPSYPNYIALTSGGTQGIKSDTLTYVSGANIFGQVDPSWRSYEEFMPTPCDHVGLTGDTTTHQYYLGRHNPAASYSSLPVGAPTAGDCRSYDIPLGTATTGALQHDVAAGTLPKFSFITPGECDDMHMVPSGDTSCPDPVAGGDAWLSQWIPILTSGPDYTDGHLLIDVVWDEGRGGTPDGSEDCTTSTAIDCIVPNIVISPYTGHVVSNARFTHYSLLKTTEELLGVPLLGHAADAGTTDLCAAFTICGTAPPPPPPPTSISFVAAAQTTANAASETVTTPTSVTAGDVMLLLATGVTTSSLATPSGWTLVRSVPNPVMTTTVWRRVATSSDPGTPVTVTFPSTVKGAVQLLAYRGASTTAPIDGSASFTAHTTTTTVTAPTLSVPHSGDWVVSAFAVKSSAVTAWSIPAPVVVRSSAVGSGGGRISVLAADDGGPVAGTAGGRTATADQAFSAETALTILLAAS